MKKIGDKWHIQGKNIHVISLYLVGVHFYTSSATFKNSYLIGLQESRSHSWLEQFFIDKPVYNLKNLIITFGVPAIKSIYTWAKVGFV